MPAAAIDEVARGDGDALVACEVVHGREHMVGLLGGALEPAAVAQGHVVVA